jgi:hypothetical protein
MKIIHVLLLCFISVLSTAGTAVALPSFSLITGAPCGSCHTNPAGGQLRSEYGTSFASEFLPLRTTHDDDFTFSGKISDNITLGGDFRSQLLYDGVTKKSAFQMMTTTLYAGVRLSKKVSFSYKQDIVNGSYNGVYNGYFNGTEAYGLVKWTPAVYTKAGLFLPDYGWRIDDHTSYTRGGDLGYTNAGQQPGLLFIPNYSDIGIEAGMYAGPLFLTGGIYAATGHMMPFDLSDTKAFSAKLTYSGSVCNLNYMLGLSGYGYRSFHMGGVMAGFSCLDSSLVVLGEADWTHDRLLLTPTLPVLLPGVNTMEAFAEIDLKVIQGFWLTAKYDMIDPLQGQVNDDSTPDDNSLGRVTLGLDFFPLPFIELRPQYRITMERPSISDNNIGFLQFHVWF